MLDRPHLSLAKTETKRLNMEKKFMNIIFGEWGLTIGFAKLEIGNWCKRNLDVENMNYITRRCSAHMCQYLKGTEHEG